MGTRRWSSEAEVAAAPHAPKVTGLLRNDGGLGCDKVPAERAGPVELCGVVRRRVQG